MTTWPESRSHDQSQGHMIIDRCDYIFLKYQEIHRSLEITIGTACAVAQLKERYSAKIYDLVICSINLGCGGCGSIVWSNVRVCVYYWI